MVVSSQEILRLCNDSVPSHPPSVVTVERGTSGAGTSYSYCGVETERGWFRSRSAAIGMQDTFSESHTKCTASLSQCRCIKHCVMSLSFMEVPVAVLLLYIVFITVYSMHDHLWRSYRNHVLSVPISI